ncbi:MAG: hypothetical protein R3E84_16620 [Pseudomonadales bacterium]
MELTSRMLATLFDVPQADRHRLIGWSNTISNADDPAYVTDVAQFWEALADCGDYRCALGTQATASRSIRSADHVVAIDGHAGHGRPTVARQHHPVTGWRQRHDPQLHQWQRAGAE